MLLVDSGANRSVISKSYFDRLGVNQETQESKLLYMADGNTAMKCYGSCVVDIDFGGYCVPVRFVIVDMQEQAILGMDFMASRGVALRFDCYSFEFDGYKIPMVDKFGSKLSLRLLSVVSVTIDPGAEVLIPVLTQGCEYDGQGLVEACVQDFTVSNDFVVARSLVQCTKGRAIARIINVQKKAVNIAGGSCVGRIVTNEGLDNHIADRNFTSCNNLNIPSHVKPLIDDLPESLPSEAIPALTQLVTDYSDIFSKGEFDMGLTNLVEHEIKVKPNTKPIRQKPHRLGHHAQKEIDRQIQEMLKRGIISESDSEWACSVVPVKKKNGAIRFCCDYRALNAVSIRDAYPLPRFDESIDALYGSKWFSTFDLLSGYFQVPLSKDAKDKSAFVTRSGLFSWNRLPQGLCTSPATFERLMEKVTRGLQWEVLLVYLDDIIVFSSTIEQHIERLRLLFDRLRLANLKVKVSKSKLLREEVHYLGHVVSASGVKTDPEKIKAIQDWQTPDHLKTLRSFLGLCGYYRRFIDDYSTIADALYQLTHKNKKFIWTEQCDIAFARLKGCLSSTPVLAYPAPDRPYIVDADSSGVGIVELSYHIGLCSCVIHALQSTCILVFGTSVVLIYIPTQGDQSV